MALPLFGPDYLKLPSDNDLWIIDPLLPVGGGLVIAGKPKAGKSLASLQMASCISDANKSDFLGFPVKTHGKVLYIQLDTNRGIWKQDIENGQTDLRLNFDAVAFVDKEIAPRPFDARTNGSKYIAECVDLIQPLVVIVDTIRKCHDGDENDSGQMKQILEQLQLAAKNCALVIVAHTRKGNPDFEDLMADIRGSNFLAGEMDCVLKVTKKRFTYEGRTVEESRLDLHRTRHGFWTLDNGDIHKKLMELLGKKENELLSTNELAHLLALETGLSKEACRSRIRQQRGEK